MRPIVNDEHRAYLCTATVCEQVASARRIISAIERLSADPRPVGVRKLQGAEDLWRLRVGEYRIIYAMDDAHRSIDVRVVRHRKDAYR